METQVRAPKIAPEPKPGPELEPEPESKLSVGRRVAARGTLARLRVLIEDLTSPLRRFWAAAEPMRAALRPYWAKLSAAMQTLSGLGWTLLAAAAGFTFLGAKLGWRELSFAAAALFFIVAGSALFAIGRTRLDVGFEVAPQRIVVGDAAAVRFSVRNLGTLPLLPLGLVFPVGESLASFTLPPLAANGYFEDVAVVPGTKRGVIAVGPVTTQRGDPFGVVRREVTWADPVELFIHPATVPLEPLGAGLLRDLEGRTTQDISMSDLAFHTLRDYAPGDDRRYIHWRSTAKFSGLGEGERFMVRQFLDTRRSHIAVVTDVLQASYQTVEEFELALSVGASIAIRALADEMDLTLICGDHAAVQPAPHQALDTYSRAKHENWQLSAATGRLNQLAPEASVAILITGPNCDFAEFQRARAFLPREVTTLVLRVVAGGRISLQESVGLTMVTIGRLSDLPRVLAGGQLV
jgi:uncharacterized protein (DUF58 family)